MILKDYQRRHYLKVTIEFLKPLKSYKQVTINEIFLN